MLSAGAMAAPNLNIQEYMPGSLRSRTGSRGQPLGLRTATANEWTMIINYDNLIYHHFQEKKDIIKEIMYLGIRSLSE